MKLLASYWNHTWDDMFMFLHSLDDLRKHYNSNSYGSMSIEVVRDFSNLSRAMRKPNCFIFENKGTDQLWGNHAAY